MWVKICDSVRTRFFQIRGGVRIRVVAGRAAVATPHPLRGAQFSIVIGARGRGLARVRGERSSAESYTGLLAHLSRGHRQMKFPFELVILTLYYSKKYFIHQVCVV